ncbi:MAG: DUF4954 family protein [Spirochaetes bacterium]|nr:DUF4954 family protein [Spirochaetota bacterium]
MLYRKLNEREIGLLELQNCSCSPEGWDTISVKDMFDPGRVRNVQFSGNVKIGLFNKDVLFPGGIKKASGLYDSSIHNCSIGDNVLISNVQNIANYIVEEDVLIYNTRTLIVEGVSTFGSGVKLEVLNEGGGREITIFDRLSSQMAYFLVSYRHNRKFIQNFEKIIDKYIKSKEASRGVIGKGSRIENSSDIKNILLGEYAGIRGALYLENGTIQSCKEDPALIGEGVIAKNFIILSGSRVDGSAIIRNCFIGQGVKIGNQYSAENSVFFANCEGYHGEACSIFAGPYTVTHHKSTLLIAGMFSFYNAGSGTNQSNHMYKLGPVHQGILERGSKTGSFSYLLWPCRIGAFSAVIGKHYSNFDTSDFPFSYITDDNGMSILTPAMNLFTVGTRRDSTKWPSRDRRRDPDKLDLINFDLFSPYIVEKMLKGSSILIDLYEKTDKGSEYVKYNGIRMKRLMLKSCSKYYSMAVKIFLGRSLLDRLGELNEAGSFKTIKERMFTDANVNNTKWLDISGMVTPAEEVDELIRSIELKKITQVSEVEKELKNIYNKYSEAEWKWTAGLIQKIAGRKSNDLLKEDIIKIIEEWKENSIKLNNMILKDAEKEFDSTARIGFGIDGDNDIKEKDFKAVRGKYEENDFITSIIRDSKNIEDKASSILEKLHQMTS